MPSQVLSDRGAAFLSRLLKEICNLLGVKKINTMAYHPQTNGLTERFNRTLTDMLAKRVDKNGTPIYHSFCLLIRLALKSQSRTHHFI